MTGVLKGKVAIIKNKKDYYRIREETILIAKNTHPELTIVINKIKAIITETDNKLRHAAIIAREYDKPLLMGIKNATKEFKNGDKVMIDFSHKIVNKIK